MKKILFLSALLMGLMSFAKAQPKSMQTVTFKTPTVQCESCKQRIENFLAKEEGVVKSTVNFRNHTTKVVFYTDKTNAENLKTAIANAGYDADNVTADAEAYKRLPQCCKKPEDGGGQKKKG